MDKETSRLEAFSDGVFAIAITLLILEIRVPQLQIESNGDLLLSLGRLWPSFLAFVLSFFVVLLILDQSSRTLPHGEPGGLRAYVRQRLAAATGSDNRVQQYLAAISGWSGSRIMTRYLR